MRRKIIKPRKRFCIACADYRARSYGLDTRNLYRNVLGSYLYTELLTIMTQKGFFPPRFRLVNSGLEPYSTITQTERLA